MNGDKVAMIVGGSIISIFILVMLILGLPFILLMGLESLVKKLFGMKEAPADDDDSWMYKSRPNFF